MQNKKSVLLYCDIIHTVEKLDDETAGKLFKHYLRYINDLDPKTDNLIVDISFEPIKQNLKRDLVKWDEKAERSRSNGKKGGRPKKTEEVNNETQKTQQVNLKPKEPVKGKVTVNVKGKVKDKKKEDIHLSFDHLSITKTECNKLAEIGYSKKQIEDVLESVQNFKGNTKYKSLYLTSKKWLEREHGKPLEEEKPKGRGFWKERPDGTGKAWISTEK